MKECFVRSKPKHIFLCSGICAAGVLLMVLCLCRNWLQELYYDWLVESGSGSQRLHAAQQLASLKSISSLNSALGWCNRDHGAAMEWTFDGEWLRSSLKEVAFEHGEAALPCLLRAIECGETQYVALTLLKELPPAKWHIIRSSILGIINESKKTSRATNEGAPINAAYDVVVAMGSESGKDVISLLEVADRDTQYRASILLSRIGKPMVPDIISFLRQHLGADGSGRYFALRALWLAGKEAKEAVPFLLEHIATTDKPIRSWVIRILAAVGEHADLVIRLAAQDLREDDYLLRREALYALAELGCYSATVLEDMLRCLDDSNEEVRGAAATALGELGSLGKAAIDGLTFSAEHDPDEEVRGRSREALKRIILE